MFPCLIKDTKVSLAEGSITEEGVQSLTAEGNNCRYSSPSHPQTKEFAAVGATVQSTSIAQATTVAL